MGNDTTLNSKQLYEKKKIRIGLTGLLFGVIATISALIPSVFAGVAESMIFIGTAYEVEITAVVILIYSLIIVGCGDFFAGFVGILFCGATKRNPIKEMKRTLALPVSWYMCIGAFIAGPVGTASALASYFMCGVTMGASVLAFTPLILSILSKIIFKEKLSPRVYFGICILVLGTVIGGLAPIADGMPHFYIGIACALLSAVAFSVEGLCATYAADLIDNYIGCSLFRCFFSGIMCFIVGIVVAAATGHLEFFITFFKGLWVFAPWIVLICAIGNCASYNFIYAAVVKCGPARTQAMVYTSPFWSIPIGLVAHAVFGELYEYAYSTQTIIGAIVVVVGVILIICKPSELLQLRDN